MRHCRPARALPLLPLCGLALVLSLVPASRAAASSLTDMAGQTVTLADTPRRVYALSPPDTLLVYALDPCRLAGWNYPLPPTTDGFQPPCAANLPLLGGYFGKNAVPNTAAILAAKPDLAISGSMAKPYPESDAFFSANHIPLLHIVSQSPADYAAAFRLLGQALHQEKRAEALAAYADQTLTEIRQGLAKIPENKRVTVYYAEGGDGLHTDGRGSIHTLVLELAGGRNIYTKPPTGRFGMDRVSMETVVAAAPQVILVQDAKCRDMILSSPAWKDLPAVKSGRVALIPDAPWNWFDRPPSFMRLLGLKWVAHLLYPDIFPYAMPRETQTFFRLFFGKELTEAEAAALVAGKVPARP